jgi:diguanylate cyclase (GGDEF)-like protein/PAS domain S-box-containing protein
MVEANQRRDVSSQLAPERLPGARRRIPVRVLPLSLVALAIATWAALTRPDVLAGYNSLTWLLILIPAFVLAYYRGWRSAARVLVAGTMLLLGIELIAEFGMGISVDWRLLFWVVVVVVAVGAGLAVVTELLQRERREALVLAYSDTLTGLPNRRLLDFMLDKEFAAAQRGRPLSVALVDIDGLADYNVRHGQQAGDAAIRSISAIFGGQIRTMNIGGRYDGDAFLAILSGEKIDGAWVFAERTRSAVVTTIQTTGLRLSVSVGVAQYELWMRSPGDLLDAAGKALRRARAQGGDCVVCETLEDAGSDVPSALADLPEQEHAAFEEAWHRQAVEDAELRFRELFDGVPVGLYRATADGEILDANPALVRMFGYPDRQSLMRINAADVYADRADRERWQHRLKQEDLVRDYEVRLRRYDGSIMWGRDTARAVLGRDGVVRYYTGVLEDITERKEAEEELRHATEKLRAVFDAAPVALISLDLDGRVLSWNRAAVRMLGWSEGETLAMSSGFVETEKLNEFRQQLESVMSGASMVGAEVRRQKKDGTPLVLNVYTAPLYGSDGLVTGIMGVMVDMTQARELEAQLAQSQRMESIGRLAGGIAHDFNNLLTVILGNCEIVLKDLATSSPQHRDIEEIKTAADHAAALTRKLLAFSRRQVLQPKVLSLNSVVAEMLEMLGRIIGEDVELVTSLDAGLASTLADPVEMGQIVMNLAVNARDAMPGGGRLTITTENAELDGDLAAHGETIPPGSYVKLTIKDTGIGMDQDTCSKIFEPFFTTKPKGEGTGLGLATVYGIIKQSGGHIAVESRRGEGTSIRIFLPQIEAQQRVREGVKQERIARAKACETILLVEDEPALRGPMRRGLEREGYTVLEAPDGNEALRICETHPEDIHVMVTDVVMPGMDGLELGRRVALHRPGTRVLYASGYADAMSRESVREGDFLQKPYTPSELGQRIRQMLARGEEPAAGRHGLARG